ncbi:c-type cytochrome biogenesis protein CcmI [Paraglaciecola sp. Hal342]
MDCGYRSVCFGHWHCCISLDFEGRKRQDTLTNTRLIRQRLNELEREEREGLLSHEDRLETEKDLKIALLDEQEQTQQKITSARGVLLIGGILSVVGVAFLY